jgi:hypothetical protein
VASRRRPSGRISKIPHPLLLNDCIRSGGGTSWMEL